jgi:concanavalin A-like lectin/glucanase superfamily protein/FecR-like protein
MLPNGKASAAVSADTFVGVVSLMADFDSLIHRFLEDRGSLSPRELDELIAGLRADPQSAAALRDQLVLDDLLAQKFTLDRRNFVAQVEQRIADFNRGHEELNQQVADLRSMAAAEKTLSSPGRWRWSGLVLALSALVIAGLVVYQTGLLENRPPSIAKVTSFQGTVKIEQQGGESHAAEIDDALQGNQRIIVPRGGAITITYQDGSELRVKGDSAVTFGDEQPAAAKQIRIERGEVVAGVKQQLAGPMRFTTPHAVITAPASLLRLVVTDESTLLDVSEGKVQFDRLADKQMLVIAANESGLASRETLQKKQLTWPDRRDGLSYLFSPLESGPNKDNKPLTVVRNADTRDFRVTALETRGEATLLESRWFYELNGGYLFSEDAGPDIFKSSRGGSELTLEAVFSPASLDQAGPARIVALGDESDDPDFALAQDGSDVTFSLRTDAKTTPATPPRLTINTADTPLHLTVTYRYGELIAYRDGMEIARSKDLWGSLAAWRSGPLTVGADASGEHAWRGVMEAIALYNRCLEPGEVARNARNYRLLAGRGM